MPETELRARLALTDNTSPLWLKEETLVYLLQEVMLAGNEELRDGLTHVLLGRIRQFVTGQTGKFVVPAEQEDCVQDCVAQLFTRLLQPNSGEYGQVRFWHLLKTVVIQVTIRYSQSAQRGNEFVYLDDTAEEAGELPAPAQLAGDKLLAAREGLRQIPEPLRTAFVLYHYSGWQIASLDPRVPTISRHFGTTDRTTRNWLRKAEQILQKWRGETND